MADFSIAIADADVPTVFAAFGDTFGYQATVPNPAATDADGNPVPDQPATIANPQSLEDFARQQVIFWISSVVSGYRSRQAQAAAAAQAASQAPVSIQ